MTLRYVRDRIASEGVWAAGLVGLAVLTVAGMVRAWWPHTIDDSFITYRYAQHLASGLGPVYNIGERVEGYSCPLWMSILAVPSWMGLDLEASSKWLSVAFAAATAALVYVVVARQSRRRIGAAAAVAWFCSNMSTHVYAVSGMETLSYAFFVTAAVAAPLVAKPDWARAGLSFAALTAVCLSRPEGPLVAACIAFAWLWQARDRWQFWGTAAVGAVLVVGLAFRVGYYGDWLPNTFYAKPSMVTAALAHGNPARALVEMAGTFWSNVLRSVTSFGGVGLVFFSVAGLCLTPRRGVAAPAAAALVGGTVFLLVAPQDWMTGHRFALPFLPVALVLAGLGIDHVVARSGSQQGAVVLAVVAASLFGVLGNVGTSLRELRDYRQGVVNPALSAGAYLEMGEILRRDASPGDAVLAYEVGAVGFRSGLTVVDHEGLVDRRIGAIIRDAGGYDEVRLGRNGAALRQLVDVCDARAPAWFLVRTSRRPLPELGAAVPPELGNEPVQRALLERLSPRMRLHAVVDLGVGGRERYLILRRSEPLR